MAEGVFTIEEIREQILEAVEQSRSEVKEHDKIDASHLKFVHDADTYDKLIISIDQLAKQEPFNAKLQRELGLVKGLTQAGRSRR